MGLGTQMEKAKKPFEMLLLLAVPILCNYAPIRFSTTFLAILRCCQIQSGGTCVASNMVCSYISIALGNIELTVFSSVQVCGSGRDQVSYMLLAAQQGQRITLFVCVMGKYVLVGSCDCAFMTDSCGFSWIETSLLQWFSYSLLSKYICRIYTIVNSWVYYVGTYYDNNLKG